jgi:hypothetical protein
MSATFYSLDASRADLNRSVVAVPADTPQRGDATL